MTPWIYAQEDQTIAGRVTTFGEIPLNHVEITASKSGTITYSDSLGNFSLGCSENDKLVFSAYGFDRRKLKAEKCHQATIDLVYSNRESSFDDATENNHINELLLTRAIEKYPLKGEKYYGDYDNIYDVIQNEIKTVRVSGKSVTTIKTNSFTQSQEVLFVVDGTITSDISFILPMNVKSIRYVEGTGAAKYGSRGANGAIEITLK
jgi:hypothetical protein